MKYDPLVLQKLAQLQNKYAGQRGLLLGCGESLNHVDDEVLRDTARDSIVIAIKQAYFRLPANCQFHVVSKWKSGTYTYKGSRGTRPYVIALDHDHHRYMGCADLRLPLKQSKTSESLVYRQDFGNWTLARTPTRLHGPGLVYEIGLYLALYLGLAEVISLGVDFNGGAHFYENDPEIMKTLPPNPRMHGPAAELQAHVDGIVPFRDWLLTQGVRWRVWKTPVDSPLLSHLPHYPR